MGHRSVLPLSILLSLSACCYFFSKMLFACKLTGHTFNLKSNGAIFGEDSYFPNFQNGLKMKFFVFSNILSLCFDWTRMKVLNTNFLLKPHLWQNSCFQVIIQVHLRQSNCTNISWAISTEGMECSWWFLHADEHLRKEVETLELMKVVRFAWACSNVGKILRDGPKLSDGYSGHENIL